MPPVDPKSGDRVACLQDILSSVNNSCLHEPDLITTSIGLHGRVISGTVVNVTLVGGLCALQGGTKLGGVSDVVCFLGITTELSGNRRARAGEKGHDLAGKASRLGRRYGCG